MRKTKYVFLFLYFVQFAANVTAVDVTKPINSFGLEILKFVPPDTNVMISPFSICTAVAMLNAGAAGDTKDQIDTAFGWSDSDDISAEYKELLEIVNGATSENFILNSKNKMYVDLTFTPLQSYTDLLRDNFAATVEAVNFKNNDNSATVNLINTWVEQSTNGKIKNMFSSISNDVQAILINTIYFKANWRFPFTSITQEEFYLDMNYAVKTDTMHIEKNLDYFSNSDMELIKFPYSSINSRLNLVVIKPKSRAGLSDVEKKIEYQFSEIQSWMDAAETKALNVSMPKFQFKSKLDKLKYVLNEYFGVTDAFSPNKANFSGISSTAGLFVSSIIHQSFVSVDENGTEAAAATAIGMRGTSVQDPVEYQIVLINQPFMFIICDETNGLILFSGRMVVPDQNVMTAKYLSAEYTGSAKVSTYGWLLVLSIICIL